jgi:16S rRNA (cytidine1402-2'-O)-methyltransferase
LGVLILAATPIGNLGDASPRLKEVLTDARFIAAEDTRNLLKLASMLQIKLNAKLFSLHEHNETERLAQIIEIAQDETVVVVSDAGMPTVSDPGFALVRAAAEAGIEITVIPGPSAVLAALSVSGLPTDRFTFEGFLPRKPADRRKALKSLANEQRTMVFFESPHRIRESLQDAAQTLGQERKASVSRELTKKFEHTERGTLADLALWAEGDPKGEMVIVISGAQAVQADAQDLVSLVNALVADGVKLKEAVSEVAATNNASKSELYQLVLDSRTAE